MPKSHQQMVPKTRDYRGLGTQEDQWKLGGDGEDGGRVEEAEGDGDAEAVEAW